MFGKSQRRPKDLPHLHHKYPSDLIIEETRDKLDAGPSAQPLDSRLGDTMNVVPKDLAMFLDHFLESVDKIIRGEFLGAGSEFFFSGGEK
jgi:hypothetical protein